MASELQDDPAITGSVILWRRIPPWADRVTWDPVTGEPIPSSMNFRDKHDALSVFIKGETDEATVMAGHAGYGLVELQALEVRKILGESCMIAREQGDPEPGHVQICGKITRMQATLLKRACRWVPGRWPDPVSSK